LLPTGRALPARVWEARHRGITILLWAHLPFLFLFGVLTHHSAEHTLVDLLPVIVAATCASCPSWSRQVRAGSATFGLVACSAVLVHFSGGLIEMHFHFFVVVAIITLYQDWVPFGIAIGFTVLEHGVVGVLAPNSVYNHAAARSNPWLWALIHGAFVLAASIPLVLAWRQNEDQALRDPLTRLSNRTLLTEHLEQLLGRARPGDVALLFVDLDHFKQVNDTLGHAAGDALLVECSDRLKHCVRGGDLVGRLGGDEFAVIVEDARDATARDVAERILDAVAAPTVVSGHELVMTASVGIAFSDLTTDAQDLLRNADLAMYVAKASGRDRFEVYDDAMHEHAIQRLELEAELRRAVANDEITIACQPIVEVGSGTVTGAEVLARWTHPERGPIPPDVFIPLAEHAGVIDTLGEQIFARACDVASELGKIDGTLTVTVNVSPLQLNDASLPRTFARLLDEHGVDPGRIVVEVTEHILMQDLTVAAYRLAELKKIGVRIAVDDFGVGHSSLSYLRNLPVDVLKIDKSFIDHLPQGADVTRVMIQLGRMLGLDVVAEGVESRQQHEQLSLLGCQRAQGYLFARPMPPATLLQLLLEGRLAITGAGSAPVVDRQVS
jgi:diguanylate cyclase (GGDEF)-like protein